MHIIEQKKENTPPQKKTTQKPNNNNNKTSKEPLPDVVNNNIADVRFILFYNLFFFNFKGRILITIRL